MSVSIPSKALEANLRRTAAEVTIPEEQRLLLQIVEPLYGVHQDVEGLLREINHPYVGWRETLTHLGFRSLDSFDHFNRDPRGEETVGVICSLFAKAARQARPEDLRDEAMRLWFNYLERIVEGSGAYFARNLPALIKGLLLVGEILAEDDGLAVSSPSRIKRFCRALVQHVGLDERVDEVLDVALDLLSGALAKVYRLWLSHEDPLAWMMAHEVSSASVLEVISHEALRGFLDALSSCPAGGERVQAILALPDNARLEGAYIEAASAITSGDASSWRTDLARSEWLLMILSTAALSAVHQTALRQVVYSTASVLRKAEVVEAERFVHQLFELFRQERFSASATTLDSIGAIGLEVLSTGSAVLVDALFDEIIGLEFNAPEIVGVNDDWQVQVNPAHLKNIRVFLALIAANPHRARRLIAALVVHLRLGGVFLADTDLFQKDISALLACDIEPVYPRIKQLLRVFPVYFNEIGAEGELRDVSTRIDQITDRRDPLCHFLRKQCHVESNPRLVELTRGIVRFWTSGQKEDLEALIPQALYESLDPAAVETRELSRIFSSLDAGDDPLTDSSLQHLIERMDTLEIGSELAREKARLLLRLHDLLRAKYGFSHHDVMGSLRSSQRLSQQFQASELEALEEALAKDEHEQALERILIVLERLKAIVLSPEKFEAVEDIYHKRHIAVGIPSMYGRYMETKFDAMGLTFRLETLAAVLFEKLFAAENLNFMTKRGLTLSARWLRLLLRALRVDGFKTTGLEAPISMLERANLVSGVSIDQYLNIFQFIALSIKNHIRVKYLDVFETLVEEIVARQARRRVNGKDDGLKRSEVFLRELLSQSFGLQQMDGLITRILGSLAYEKERLDVPTLNLLMTYNVDRCFAPIRTAQTPHDDIIHLGNKGFQLKRLANFGYQVPYGFIITTEVFRCLSAISAYEELRRDIEARTMGLMRRLEHFSGKRFGDPGNPLLLSVRSGAAVSMPGMLDTFLNVGMTSDIAEGLSAKTGSSWFAWDCYRRFLQSWGMSFGMGRDLFDGLIRDMKEELGIAKKSQLPPEAMRDLALCYRRAIEDNGIKIIDDPTRQLFVCIAQVLASWFSENARTYRSALKIAEEWGTAVIVQAMVFGNLSPASGSGVTFTRHPNRPAEGVSLYGDFAVHSQGEDVVNGLVETFPITERQRKMELESRQCTTSLEKDFGDVYQALCRHATEMVTVHGMSHQEIEFTFEGPSAAEMYLLQTRDIDLGGPVAVQAFVASLELSGARLGAGVGSGGGALSGRVAYTLEDIERLREDHPGDKIILVRPDTVPDDILLISKVDGLLTSVGGATSHAAVAAQRLGRTCVVGCRQLQVRDDEGWSKLSGHLLRAGELVSIDGLDGSIYLGSHAVTQLRVHEQPGQ